MAAGLPAASFLQSRIDWTINLKKGKAAMGLIAEIVREFPALAKHQVSLEAMERDNARLKTENAELKIELAQYIEKWETLDGDAVRTLRYLAQAEYDNAGAIAREHDMNIQIAELYLQFLVTHAYVAAPVADGKSAYGLTHKGRRYLLERGFLK
jgi:predicted transcriptional regulator